MSSLNGKIAIVQGRSMIAGLRRVLVAATSLASLSMVPAAPATAAVSAQCGGASWYALDGRRTANGEIMNSGRLTAAHRRLPFGSLVTVRNKRNGRSVIVRINDRGPFVGGRIIDLSRAAAQRIGMIGTGVASICMSRGTALAMNDDTDKSRAATRRGKRVVRHHRSFTAGKKSVVRASAAGNRSVGKSVRKVRTAAIAKQQAAAFDFSATKRKPYGIGKATMKPAAARREH